MRDEKIAKAAAAMVEQMVLGNTEGALTHATEITNSEIVDAMTFFASFVDSMAVAMERNPGGLHGIHPALALKTLNNMHKIGADHLAHLVFGIATQRAKEIIDTKAAKAG